MHSVNNETVGVSSPSDIISFTYSHNSEGGECCILNFQELSLNIIAVLMSLLTCLLHKHPKHIQGSLYSTSSSAFANIGRSDNNHLKLVR